MFNVTLFVCFSYFALWEKVFSNAFQSPYSVKVHFTDLKVFNLQPPEPPYAFLWDVIVRCYQCETSHGLTRVLD